MLDSKTRFSERADDYAKYRPGYPAAVLAWLEKKGLERGQVVADVGAGTGLFTELLLRGGHRVVAVEPNDDMRARADAALASNPRYSSVRGTAEATTLDAASVDLVAAGQAFHWFDPAATKTEWRRILRGDGRVTLIWNDRLADASPFMADYERLLRAHGSDYAETTCKRRPLAAALASFFEGAYETHTTPNAQRLDEAGLIGRFFSSSYTPSRGDPGYGDAVADARAVFSRHAEDDAVELLYSTTIYLGRLT